MISGDDGRPKIQLRLDLGLLQMEVDGRPDGQRVHDHESWLDYYEHRQQAQDASRPDGPPFVLTSSDCEHLLREGVQYYHRYLSFWHLQHYALCQRDTARNLRLFAFVRAYAQSQRDKLQFDQWRPYVTMMHARAVAAPHVEGGDYARALAAIDEGIAGIEQFLTEYKQTHRVGDVGEIGFLKRWRREILAKAGGEPVEDSDDPVRQLKEQLEQAVAQERYEDAARLRDELRRLTNPPPPKATL